MKQEMQKRICTLTAMAVLLSGSAMQNLGTRPVASAAAVSAAAAVISGTAEQNFTAQGLNSSYFDITGNLSDSKGTVTYQGMTLTTALKMESSTQIGFSTSGAAVLTLVIRDGTTFYVDEVRYDIPANGVFTVNLGAGTHSVRKGSGSSNLFYISVSGDGTPVTTTAPAQSDTPPVSTGGQGGTGEIGNIRLLGAGGWNEMLYAVFSGIRDADVTAVSYAGPVSGKLSGDDFSYLVRDTSAGLRIDIPGLPAGSYTLTVETQQGTAAVKDIAVSAQDRSGFAHFGFKAGVGAYTDSGTLKANAIVLYVTNDNKNSVTVRSKDGTTVTGIGNILNSAGASSNSGSRTNSNQGIIKKLAEDGTPLVVRILGDVKAPDGLTAYNSTDYGGSVGDNGYMARMKSGKDITVEGIGTDAQINGWGMHFMAETAATSFGKSFEVRNLKFRNVPEDCIGMEGVQSGDALTASVERCWIHNNEFYKPTISNPAESDKDGGDGACDFKRGMYFTNSYNYYEGYHKTNLVGASDTNLQFHITFHHNYWKNCESRGPLARQADIHMYNNVFEGQTSYCQNPRADAYIFSEYNLFENCKNPQQIKQGAIKSFHDTLTNCRGDMNATVVYDKSQRVSSNNRYGDFDTNSALSYIPSGQYLLQTDTGSLKSYFQSWGGTLDDQAKSGTLTGGTPVVVTTEPVQTTLPETTTLPASGTTVSQEPGSESADPGEVMFGDIDCNRDINVADCVLFARFLAEDTDISVTTAGKRNADCNRDTWLTSDDNTLILEYLAGIRETPVQS